MEIDRPDPAEAGGASPLTLLRAIAAQHGDREAIVDGAVRLTYGALVAEAETAARAFLAAGLKKGEAAAIWAPNIHEWIVAALGLQACGGVLTPLNTRYKGGEALDVLRRSKARLLLTVRGFLGNDYPEMLRAADARAGEGAIAGLPHLREVIVLRGDAGSDRSWRDFLALGASVPKAFLRGREADVRPDDISDIMFTSGTTGNAKGAMLTHRHMRRGIETIAEILGLGGHDRYLIIPPFFHTFGYRYGFMLTLLIGARGILQDTLDARQVLQAVERERVSFLPGPPTLFYALLNEPTRGSFDLSSLRVTLVGAAVVPETLVRQLKSELRFETVATGYGLTETTGIGTVCRREDDDETIATTSGRAVPGAEVKVVDADGREQPRGTAGEVWIRGFLVMKGYLDDPGQTQAAITPDGWMRTGDVGVMDERGYLRIVDRIKDLFIVGGFNAYPAEIEAQMLLNENIEQAAVVGAPDARLGEVGVAFVKLRAGSTATEAEIIGWCRQAMANYKVPRIVKFLDTFPLNASGKVLKSELREKARTLAADAPASQ